jgi:hypothetical protein
MYLVRVKTDEAPLGGDEDTLSMVLCKSHFLGVCSMRLIVL